MDTITPPTRGWLSARRADALRGRLAQLAQDLDGYRSSYLRLEAEVGQLRCDADGYRTAYEALAAEVGQARADAAGYKAAHDKLAAEAGQARCDADGYRAAYDQLAAEVGQLRCDADGYRTAYEALAAEVGQARADAAGYRDAFLELQAEVGQLRCDAGGYRSAYEAAQAEAGQLRCDADGHKGAYEKLVAEVGQARCDADGYRAAYDQLAAEVGRLRCDADGYRQTYLRREADVARLEAAAATAAADRDGYRGAFDEASTEASRYRLLLGQAAPPDRGRQFVFLHVQKTGGISLLDFLGRQFDWYRTLWVFSPAEFDAHPPDEVRHFDRVCGHFTGRNLAAVRPGALLATVVRDPADRVLSCYGYFRAFDGRMRESIRHAVASAKANPLLDFLRDPTPEVRRHLLDHQAHALAGDWAAPDDRPPAALRDAAVAALGRFDWVGRTETLDADLVRLCRLTGWVPPDRLARLNVTASRQRVDELTAAERDAVRELTAVDEEVYRAATRLGDRPA